MSQRTDKQITQKKASEVNTRKGEDCMQRVTQRRVVKGRKSKRRVKKNSNQIEKSEPHLTKTRHKSQRGEEKIRQSTKLC